MKKIVQNTAPRQGAVKQLVLEMPELVQTELHALVVGAGMMVLGKMLEAERTDLCGPRYTHASTRTASRAGTAPGELALGGRRVAVRRPRVRAVGGDEVALKTWEAFAQEDALMQRAVEQMVIGVSTRKYERSLEPIDVKTRGVSKSAVSRRFVAMTQSKLDEMLNTDLSKFDLAVLMIDGIHIGDHVVPVALGIDVDGKKHVLGLHEGATENSVACTALLASLAERGMRTDRSTFVAIDGGKGLRKAVVDVFGKRAVIQRCQLHKRRNVTEHLPESLRKRIDTAMAQAYRLGDVDKAKKLLMNTARMLEGKHPSAAASLREGLDETLTVMRFHLPAALVRTLSSTNPIENIQGGIRRVCRRVTTWNGGSMILRWVGAALVEHARGFRRLRGHAGMPKLVAALRALDAATGVAQHVKAA